MKAYLRRIRGYIILSLLLYLAETVVTSELLLFPGRLVDFFLAGSLNQTYFLQNILLKCLLYFLAYLLIVYGSNRVADYRRIRFEKELKKDFFAAIIHKSPSDFAGQDIGEYISMQSNDITELCQGYLSPLLSLFRSAFMVLIFGYSLVKNTDYRIAITVMASSFLISLIPKITADQLSSLNADYMASLGKYMDSTFHYFSSYQIQDQAVKETLIARNEEELDALYEKNMTFRRLNSRAMVMNGGGVEFLSIITFLVVALLLFQHKITVGMATIAFTYSTKFMEPIYELSLNMTRIHSVAGIKDRFLAIVGGHGQEAPAVWIHGQAEPIAVRSDDQGTAPIAGGHSQEAPRLEADRREGSLQEICLEQLVLEVKGLRFSYPDMTFRRGENYLIVGENGSGKSLLLNAILSFIQPCQGRISFDGSQLNQPNDFIAFVPQVPIIFPGSYLENVTVYGAYSAADLASYEQLFPEKIIRAIKKDDHLDHLSSGEKQAIAILRALCSGKSFLLFDEPFSVMNREVIDRFLRSFTGIGRTFIVTGHNLDAWVDRFDQVYRLEGTKEVLAEAEDLEAPLGPELSEALA